MKRCAEHRIVWEDKGDYPGCPYCLAKEIETLRKAVTRAQADSTVDVKRRRKAEWEFLRFQDEMRRKQLSRDFVAASVWGNKEDADKIRDEIIEMDVSEEEYDATFDGTNSDKWKLVATPIDPKVLLALCELRDDLDHIKAMGWHLRVVKIINLVTGYLAPKKTK